MKLAWASDIHLDMVRFPGQFGDYVPESDALVITGDISRSEQMRHNLEQVRQFYRKPIYFVMGNHDFWGSSFEQMESVADRMTGTATYLRRRVIALTVDCALVGVDGWYDGRFGKPFQSNFEMNDWTEIMSLRKHYDYFQWNHGDREYFLDVLRLRADRDAADLLYSLSAAIEQGFSSVIVATHIPPFDEVAVHEGRPQHDYARPWYVSKATGDVLDSVAEENPQVNFTVLCGHTHSRNSIIRAPNMIAKAAQSNYGFPEVECVIEID